MSIQFKFRSSPNFETLDIENRSSISVGELRARILRGKFSQQQQGFDLVFSDALSGSEYKGDDYQIPRGSSVIVKRVPGGTVPSTVLPIQAVKDIGKKELHNTSTPDGPKEKFDNANFDLCPMPDSNFPNFNFVSDKNNLGDNEKDDIHGSRLGCRKDNARNLDQAINQRSIQPQDEKNTIPRLNEQMGLNKLPASNLLALQNSNFPLELKCPLCNTFFKDAVMIPCCQHSFCDKCIHQVLIDKGRCPKCFSNKCNVQNLLPNLSLRQAIEHLRESQMLTDDLENARQKDVPDEESGIQAKDVSCAITVVQREQELPQSSCATGKGSNQVFIEGFHGRRHGRNVPYIGFDFQAENQTVIPQANAHNEADSSTKRKGGSWIDSAGGDRNFLGLGGYRKGTRTCYACGSPDHLLRECPLSNQNPVFQPENGAFHGGMPGFAPPYWNSSSLPPFRPYANMYSNPGMVPFNAPMVPVSPFVAPPYIPSMSGSLPGPGGNIGMGSIGPPCAPDHFGFQPCENKRKHSHENIGREQLADKEDDTPECYHHSSLEKSNDNKVQKDIEPSYGHSGDSLGRGLGRKSQHDKHLHSADRYVDERHEKGSHSSFAGRDKRQSHAERSHSGKDELARSSDRHSDGRHKHHHEESKKYHERKGHCGSDLSLGHYSSQKDDKRKNESDVRSSQKKYHTFPESGPVPNSPNEWRGYKERDAGHDSRYSRQGAKHFRDEQYDERRQIVSGSNKDSRVEYRYQKRRAY